MNKETHQYDYILYIGRFQPFHNGHLETCKQALKFGKHLLVMIGSMFIAPNIRNPITFQDRRMLIDQCLTQLTGKFEYRYSIHGLRDYFYSANDSLWISQIQSILASYGEDKKIAIIGHEKDETSYYIQALEKTLGIDFIPVNNTHTANATDLRNVWLNPGMNHDHVKKNIKILPENILNFIYDKIDKKELKRLRDEWIEVYEGKKKYPGTSVAADAIVTCAGFVLVGERKGKVGRGQIAFPGGFISEKDIHLVDTCIRELREETRLKVAEPILRGSVKKSKLYSHKLRDVRGRIVTEVFHIDLKIDPKKGLPLVKADDDFKNARWVPIYWLQQNPQLVFADHWEIFENLVGF